MEPKLTSLNWKCIHCATETNTPHHNNNCSYSIYKLHSWRSNLVPYLTKNYEYTEEPIRLKIEKEYYEKSKLRMPEFKELLDKMLEIHIKKNQDYATDSNPMENFERQAELMSWFKNDIDKVFAGMIALKMARLATLLNKEGDPENESIEDTFLDLPNYTVLWSIYRKVKTKLSSESPKPSNPHLTDVSK